MAQRITKPEKESSRKPRSQKKNYQYNTFKTIRENLGLTVRNVSDKLIDYQDKNNQRNIRGVSAPSISRNERIILRVGIIPREEVDEFLNALEIRSILPMFHRLYRELGYSYNIMREDISGQIFDRMSSINNRSSEKGDRSFAMFIDEISRALDRVEINLEASAMIHSESYDGEDKAVVAEVMAELLKPLDDSPSLDHRELSEQVEGHVNAPPELGERARDAGR